MKSRAKTLLNRLHTLQSAIYYYQSDLEEKAESVKSELKKKKYLECAQLAGDSGFELDISQVKMQNLIETL